MVVGAEHPEALAAAVASLCDDAALRAELACSGQAFAVRHHARAVVAAELVSFLRRQAGAVAAHSGTGRA